MRLGGLETLGDCFFIGRTIAVGDETQTLGGRTRLNHRDVDVATVVATTGYDEFEHGLGQVFLGGEGDPLTLLQGKTNSPYGTHEWDRADHESSRGAVERQNVERVLLVDRQRRDNDVSLVAITILEGRAEGTVDETADQSRLLGRTSFPTEEGSRDLSDGVHPLFKVDGEREEVDAFPRSSVGCSGYQHFGTAQSGYHGAIGLTGEFAGAKDEVFAANGAANSFLGHVVLLVVDCFGAAPVGSGDVSEKKASPLSTDLAHLL